MKATYDREGLHLAFQLVSAVVPTRSPKPVLHNVKMIVTAEHTTLMATDLDTGGIRLEVRGVNVEEPGEALLPMNRFTSILREATDKELRVEAGLDHCMVRGEHSEFELPGEDPVQYPDVPTFDATNYHQVQAGVLKEMISRTIFAAAQEGTRYALNGVLWEFEPEKARIVATDSRRLAVTQGPATMQGKHGTGPGQAAVVPTKSMALLERNLADPDEQILVSIRTNEALFRTSRAVIYSRLVEGRYPPYREVFPKKTTAKVPLQVGLFLSAVRQAAILTDEESKGVDFSFAKGKLTLKARVAEKGRAKVELAVDFEGKPMEITFQPKFLVDMLRVLEPDSAVTLELVDGNSAALFKAGDDYSYIVMPITSRDRQA